MTLQQLHDHGLNPFAVQLLIESYKRNCQKTFVRFDLCGVRVTLQALTTCPHEDCGHTFEIFGEGTTCCPHCGRQQNS
jgi:hypothetical protein